jgi:hypothetical protein
VSGPAAPPRRDDGQPRPPRARIDPSALAYADGALAERYGALPARRPRPLVVPRPQRLAYGGVAIASRVAGVALDVSASRFMDRVVRGRVWIGVIAFSLIGLVAMQVSMLKLNSGIGRAVQTVNTLERSNSALRSDITRLSAGERIRPLAAAQGLVMPAPADVRYLHAGDAATTAARAVRRMRAPDPVNAGLAGAAPAPALDAGIPAPASVAATTTTTAAPTASGTTAPATTGAGTNPAATAPPTTAAALAAPGQAGTTAAAPPAAQPAATAPPAAISGGASPQPTTQTP